MFKKNPEARIAMRILAIIGFLIIALLIGGYVFIRISSPQLLKFSKGITEVDIEVDLDSLDGAYFMQGMQGCENIYLQPDTTLFYVTSLMGKIYQLDTSSSARYKISRTIEPGTSALGICKGPDNYIYTVISRNPHEDWKTKGASVYRMNADMDSLERITENYPAMNGLCCDGTGNLYFATSNFNVFHPKGSIYIMKYEGGDKYSKPVKFIAEIGLANGLYYAPDRDEVLFSNTIGGVYSFVPGSNITQEVYLKLKFMEACDDLCSDISGNIWMTDPGYSTLKLLNPGTGRLVRFNIKGVGQTSSCRIRKEERGEMIYVTELKKNQDPRGEIFDGRGVLIIPLNTLFKKAQASLLQTRAE